MPIEDLRCSFKNSSRPFLCKLQKSAMSTALNEELLQFSAAFATKRSFKILAFFCLLLTCTFQIASSTKADSITRRTTSVQNSATTTLANKRATASMEEYSRIVAAVAWPVRRYESFRKLKKIASNSRSSDSITKPINFSSSASMDVSLVKFYNSTNMKNIVDYANDSIITDYFIATNRKLHYNDVPYELPNERNRNKSSLALQSDIALIELSNLDTFLSASHMNKRYATARRQVLNKRKYRYRFRSYSRVNATESLNLVIPQDTDNISDLGEFTKHRTHSTKMPNTTISDHTRENSHHFKSQISSSNNETDVKSAWNYDQLLNLSENTPNRTKSSILSKRKTSQPLSDSQDTWDENRLPHGVQNPDLSSDISGAKKRPRRGLNSFQAGHGATREARIYSKQRRGFIQFSPTESDRINVSKSHSKNGTDVIEISFLCQQAGLSLGPCPHITSSSNVTSEDGNDSVLEVILLRFQKANRYICVDSSARIYLKETLDRKPHECSFRHKLLHHKHDVYYSHAYPDSLRRCSRRPTRSTSHKSFHDDVEPDLSANIDYDDADMIVYKSNKGSRKDNRSSFADYRRSLRKSRSNSHAAFRTIRKRSSIVVDRSKMPARASAAMVGGNRTVSSPSGGRKRLNCQARWFLGVNRAGFLRVFKQVQLKSKVLFIQRWLNPSELLQGGVSNPPHHLAAKIHPSSSPVPSSPPSVLNINNGPQSNTNKRKTWWNFDGKQKKKSKGKKRKCSKLLKSCSRIVTKRPLKNNKKKHS